MLHSTANPSYINIIKRTPAVISLAIDFMNVFESRKKMTKKLYDDLFRLINENEEYDIIWHIDINGNLVDGNNVSICYLLEKDSSNAILIQFVPEI